MTVDYTKMRTTDLIFLYHSIMSKREKFKKVPIGFYKETYARANMEERKKFREDMVKTLVIDDRRNELKKTDNQSISKV